MQFSTARAEVAAQLGLDETQSNVTTLINRWLNLSQNDISSSWDWTWLQSRQAIATAIDYTTGTVDLIAGSGTITFSAVIATSQTGRFIQFSSYNDWYEITAHTAGAATATISPVYAQAANATAETFTIRTWYYTFATNVSHVYTARQADSQQYIPLVSAAKRDLFQPFSTATADAPQVLTIWDRDSSGSLQFTPFPWPAKVILIEFRTYLRPMDLSGDTDTPLFPAEFDTIWIEGAVARGYKFLDDDREENTLKYFLLRIERMKLRDNPAIDKSRILQSIDEGGRGNNIIRFPSTFDERIS